MSRVTVKVLGPANEEGGNFKNDAGENVAWTAKRQPAVLMRGEFREPMKLRIRNDHPGYAVGEYEFDFAEMLTLSNGVPQLSKFHSLTPLGPAK